MEKTRLHRINKPCLDISRGKCLDWGIADMASILLPDYTVIDGTTCMEGFGPSIGDPIQLDLVLASKDPTAADFTAMTLMGLEPDVAKYLHLVQERCGTASPEGIQVEPADYRKYAKAFRPSDSVSFKEALIKSTRAGSERFCLRRKYENRGNTVCISRFLYCTAGAKDPLSSRRRFIQRFLKNEYPNITLIERGSCSACSATCMQFIKKQGNLFPADFRFKICAGRDLSEEDMVGENVFLVGNCSAAHAAGRPFCKGCPPVGSSILAFIRGEEIT